MVKLEGLHTVTGAFGYTGRWIAHHLLKRGAKVRTLTNSIGRDDPFDGKVEVHRYDFDDSSTILLYPCSFRAIKGISPIVSSCLKFI